MAAGHGELNLQAACRLTWRRLWDALQTANTDVLKEYRGKLDALCRHKGTGPRIQFGTSTKEEAGRMVQCFYGLIAGYVLCMATVVLTMAWDGRAQKQRARARVDRPAAQRAVLRRVK